MDAAISILGAVGFALLVVHVVAHVALVVAVARSAGGKRAALALILPPLGVVWGWEAGARAYVLAYGGTLLAFATVVTAIVYAR